MERVLKPLTKNWGFKGSYTPKTTKMRAVKEKDGERGEGEVGGLECHHHGNQPPPPDH